MTMYLVNELGEVLPLERCKYWVVSNNSPALFDAIEDIGFKLPKPMKLVSHPESTSVATFDLSRPAA
ncbi:hypothetical protein ACTJK5_09765 [Agrobacterium sp. 22094]|uniref:hypothetical protein n=1 Tax=Agrobacterium sp. 22094 TaxID=3453872 RepID=UPI003F8601FB